MYTTLIIQELASFLLFFCTTPDVLHKVKKNKISTKKKKETKPGQGGNKLPQATQGHPTFP